MVKDENNKVYLIIDGEGVILLLCYDSENNVIDWTESKGEG
jgi:hypothetical protein